MHYILYYVVVITGHSGKKTKGDKGYIDDNYWKSRKNNKLANRAGITGVTHK
jgi:hypothetical protein